MKIILYCLVSLLILGTTTTWSFEPSSPIGLWKAFNDKGKATGFIRIQTNDGKIMGVIEKGLPEDKEDKICTVCHDERKNQKLIGMVMMKNVQSKGQYFLGDEILDPFSGNTYQVKLTLKDNGRKMEVRGYTGLSVFGRTQIWEREND